MQPGVRLPAPTVDQYLAGIEDAVALMAASTAEAGLDAPVPTCPGWTVRDLLAHVGMVHRWATSVVRGDDPRAVDDAALEAEGRTHPDPVGWLRAGAGDLVTALRAAPDDLDVMTFLRESPPSRRFWARRQCHETTVHALDALAARQRRPLTAADAWFTDALATDGVDELLVGFWQRRTKGPRSEHPYTAAVLPPATAREPASVTPPASAPDLSSKPCGWLLEIGPESPVTHRLGARDGIPHDARVLWGTATDLYLALWNRGGRAEDPTHLLVEWSGPGAVTW